MVIVWLTGAVVCLRAAPRIKLLANAGRDGCTVRILSNDMAGSHSVTCYPTQVNAPRLNSSPQAGTRFTYPGGMEG